MVGSCASLTKVSYFTLTGRSLVIVCSRLSVTGSLKMGTTCFWLQVKHKVVMVILLILGVVANSNFLGRRTDVHVAVYIESMSSFKAQTMVSF